MEFKVVKIPVPRRDIVCDRYPVIESLLLRGAASVDFLRGALKTVGIPCCVLGADDGL